MAFLGLSGVLNCLFSRRSQVFVRIRGSGGIWGSHNIRRCIRRPSPLGKLGTDSDSSSVLWAFLGYLFQDVRLQSQWPC